MIARQARRHYRAPRSISIVLLIVTAFAVASCGGGGEGGGSSTAGSGGTGSGGTTAAPIVSVSETAVAVGVASTQSSPAPVVIQVTVTNPPATTLQSKLTWNGQAVANATLAWQSAAAGQMTITVPAPTQLGTGNFTGNVMLQVCRDSACAQPVGNSPISIAVSYEVTPPPTFYLPQPQVGFQTTTSETNPQTTSFLFVIQNIPLNGLWVLITQPKTGFITNATFSEAPVSNGDLNVTFTLQLVSPASLGSGYFDSSVTFQICYDQACSQPIAGSPVTQPFYYTVDLTPGDEYQPVNVAQQGISDLAYDAANQQLYVSALSGYNSTVTGAVTQVDPITGALGAQLSLSDSLSSIAISDDGQYLYTGSKENPVIYRLTLSTLQQDLQIPLGTMMNGSQAIPNIVGNMAVAPGEPQTIAVALASPGGLPATAGTQVFDGAVARAQSLAPLGYYASPDSISWGSDATSLYAYRYSQQQPFDEEIDSVAVSGSGLSVESSIDLTGGPDNVQQLIYQQGQLFDLDGYVRAAATGSIVGQFQMPSQLTAGGIQVISVTPDSANGRAFMLIRDTEQSHLLLLNFSLSSYLLQAVADLGYDTFDVNINTHMIRWGSQGLAFNRNGLQLLSGTFYAAPTGGNQQARARASSRTQLAVAHLRGPTRH